MTKLYRLLLILTFTLQFFWFFIPWGFAYGEQGIHALVWHGFGSFFDHKTNIIIGNIIIAMYFLSYVGMFFYVRHMRSIYFLLIVTTGLSSPLYGITVQTGWESMFLHFLSFGDGAIIAIAYLTSVNDKFIKNTPND